MLRPSPNHRTQRLPNDDDDDPEKGGEGRGGRERGGSERGGRGGREGRDDCYTYSDGTTIFI